MEIILQKNSSEKIVMNKSITSILTIEGTLRENTNIYNPSILIAFSSNEEISNMINKFNYFSIPIFKRSYYLISPPTIINNKLIRIDGKVDVLYSFKDEILNNTAIIRRQENSWNLYLNDGVFQVYQNPQILTKEFPSGFSTQEFVLAIAGS